MTQPLLLFSHVCAAYGPRPVLTDINLRVERGSFILLTGPNGGGKTTLLRLMLGLMRPSGGSLLRTPGLRIGYQPQYQRMDKQFPITVADLVLTGLQNRLRPWQRPGRAERELVAQALQTFGLTDLAQCPASRLSGGQLQRALFVRAVVSAPDLLVIDEPDTYLDADHRAALYAYLAQPRPERAVVMVSHDATLPASLPPLSLHVAEGRVSRA